MKVQNLLFSYLLGILLLVHGIAGADSETSSVSSTLSSTTTTTSSLASTSSVQTLSTIKGITTVSTDIYRATTLSSLCAHASQTGDLNGKHYRAAYDITGRNTGTIIVSRVLTVTWFFQFDRPLNATGFSVSKAGLEISNVKGSVNLEDGSFVVSYDVTLPYLTIIVSVPLYCAADYVTFQFTVPPASFVTQDKRELPPGLDSYDLFKRDQFSEARYDDYNDYGYPLDGTYYDENGLQKRANDDTRYYAFYVGTAGAVIGTIISQTFCGLTNWFNCPVYTKGLSFDCDAFKSYLSCSDSLTLTESYSLIPTTAPSSSSLISSTLSSSYSSYINSSTYVNSSMSYSSTLANSSYSLPSTMISSSSIAESFSSGISSSAEQSSTLDSTASEPSSISKPVVSPTSDLSGTSSHSSIFTTTWTDSAGLTSTGIVSEYPTTGTDGVVGTGTTTIPITASGSSSHSSIFTTTWTDSAGLTSTGIVSEYPTTGTDGVVGTGTTTIPITASGSSASGSLSSSSGSSVPSSSGSLSAPYMTGFLQDGQPHWNIVVPGSLGPWSSVEVHSTNDGSHYDLTDLQMLVDGVVVSGPSNLTKNSYEASFEDIIERSSNLVFSVFAQAIAGKNYTNNVEVAINTIDDKKLVKRAVLKFLLSATITTDASSIGSSTSAPSSSETLSSGSASGVASDSASITGGGSFSSSSTVGEQSTTVITVTSCSDEKCSSVPITTGVTAVTSTVEGIVTTYTTYCPLTSIEAPSTTVVTITSCSSHVCSKVTATTGVTVVTETNEGTETIYTTYCPISSIAPSPENPSSMGSTAALVSTTGGASNVPQGGKPESDVGSSPSKSGPNGNAQSGSVVSHGNVGASSNTAATAPVGSNSGTAPVVAQGSHNSGVAIDSTSTQTVLATATVSNGQVSAGKGSSSSEVAAVNGASTVGASSTKLNPEASTYEGAAGKNMMLSSLAGVMAFFMLLV